MTKCILHLFLQSQSERQQTLHVLYLHDYLHQHQTTLGSTPDCLEQISEDTVSTDTQEQDSFLFLFCFYRLEKHCLV